MKYTKAVGSPASKAVSRRRIRFEATIPSLMTLLGVLVLGGLWIVKICELRIGTPGGALTLAGGLTYAGWVFCEARVSVRELTATGRTYDCGTLEIAAIAKQLLLLASLLGGSSPRLASGAGAITAIALGGGFRINAINRLGRCYTHRIRVPTGALVTAGPYGLVRHPAYLGTLVGHAGIAVLFLNPWPVAALVLGWFPVVVARTWIEDRLLQQSVPAYGAYCAHIRWRLLPGVW